MGDVTVCYILPFSKKMFDFSMSDFGTICQKHTHIQKNNSQNT